MKPAAFVVEGVSELAGSVLRLSRVSHRFGDGPWVLRGFSLSVRAGEWVALMGRNGSGKSTVARLAAGLIRPRRGQVVWSARPAYVAQDPQANVVGETVAEDVAFAAGGPQEANAGEGAPLPVERALRAVGMEWAGARPMSTLSGGELQRVAIAGALARGARLLVLDEPTSHLSVPAARQMWKAIETSLRQAGVAVLLITHRAEEAKRADRVALLSEGRIAALGPARSLLRRPELLEWAGVAPDPIEAIAGCCEEMGVRTGWPAEDERLVAAVCSLLETSR